MASGSEIPSTNKVGPTEDVIQALMDTLVDPLLPLSISNVPPQEDDQKSVAKQMHAVVLLYNYHHRKQKPDLKFLDFVSFCKLAVVVKPPLVSFTKAMMETEPMNSNTADNHLSLTEKAIKDACGIALALDASRDFPNTEGWPVYTVAVLLIDSKKENCLLRFGDVTKGVWSLIEKEINELKIGQEMLSEEKIGDKRKRNSLKASTYDDNEFLQLGYDAVKDVTGIGSSDLQVLATHVTYSLSKEKSSVRFYMMQCSCSFNVKEEVSLKFLVDSLQGPLAEKFDYGFWKTTTVVEFYHMLPYVEFISCWLSRRDLCLPSLNGSIAESTTNTCKKELTQTGKPDLPVSKYNGNDGSGTKVNSPDKISSENRDKNKPNHSPDGKVKSPVNIFPSTSKDGNDERHDIMDSAKNKKSRVQFETSDTDSQKTVIDDNVIEKLNKKHDIEHSAKREDSGRKYCEILDKDGDECDKDLLSRPSSGLKEMNADELTKSCTKSEDTNKKVSSKIRVYHHRRKNNSSTQNDARVCEDGGNLKVNTVDPLKSDHAAECRDEKVVSEDKGDVTISCQNGIAAKGNQLIQFEAKNKFDLELQNVEELQNALSLLYGKRQELCSQIRNMEDTLAFSENDIARIREGGDVGLARECTKSILSGNYHSMLEHRTQNQDNGESQRDKKTRLSEIYLPGQSSCQDLEYICLKNNWRLPRYLIEPADGKFVSNVFLHVKDLDLHSKGGFESKPCGARESAAAQMIAKLRNS